MRYFSFAYHFARCSTLILPIIISVYVVLSWCAAYSCSNAYVKRKLGVAFSVSEAPDAVIKSSACWLGPSALFLPWNRLHAYLSTHNA